MRINRSIKAYSQIAMRINRAKRVILRSEQRIYISSAAYALIAKSKQIRPKDAPLGAQRRSCPPSIVPLPPQRRRKQKGRVPHGTLPSNIIQLSTTLGYSSPQMSQLFSSFVSASPPSTGSSLIGRLSASMLVTSAKATSV